ncbi:MAG TPA: universal stress protein [Terriglobales bacterium]|nr:universal stress protein [Terriglobales bacterium]
MKLLEVSSHSGISLKNILLATDFSEASAAALPYAAAISRRYGSELHVAHMLSPAYIIPSVPDSPVTPNSIHEAARADAQQQMEALAASLKTLTPHTYVREGKVWDGLSEIVRTQQIDLLIVGTHGRTGVGKLLLGSKAEEILRQAPCPVLTVGPKVSGRAKLPELAGVEKDIPPVEISVRQIVYATDFSPESLAAAPFAASLAQEFQAKLTLLHVIEKFTDSDRRPKPLELMLQRLEKLVPEDARLWCSPRPSVQFGPPADCILQEALASRADLIVLGVRAGAGLLGAATHLPWTTAHKVIASAHCPVLTAPFAAVLQPKEERDGFYEFGEVVP